MICEYMYKLKRKLTFGVLVLSCAFLVGVKNALAHVAYVIGKDNAMTLRGEDWDYILSPFLDPRNIAIMAGTLGIILIIFSIVKHSRIIRSNLKYALKRLSSYHELIPWIIRLSIGISLIGSGTSGYLISPILESHPEFATLQIILGFLFLLGFLLVPAVLLTIGLYIFALTQHVYLIGNVDILALALAFLIFHSARPGLDDILGFSFLSRLRINRHYLAPMLRAGIGAAMIFLAVYEKFLNPIMADAVIQKFAMTDFVPVSPAMWVLSVGIIELIVGLLLFFGVYTRVTSCVAFLVLTLSFFFFKESVTAHVTLFGLLSILIIEGGGRWSIDESNAIKNGNVLVGSPVALGKSKVTRKRS